MLIEFSVGNYRSFKETVTFSMVAAKLKAKDHKIDEDNVFIGDSEISLLKSAVIYGANASGKSNFISALLFMRRLILHSSKETQAEEGIDVKGFRLGVEADTNPSFFEIVFLLEGKKYRYGFEVNSQQVISEWLFYSPTTKEAKLFTRNSSGITLSNSFKEGKGIIERTRTNALFLSVVAQFNGTISRRVLSYFRQIGVSWSYAFFADPGVRHFTLEVLYSENRSEIIEFVKKLNLGIEDIQIEQVDLFQDLTVGDVPSEVKKYLSKELGDKKHIIRTIHKRYNSKGRAISNVMFDLDEDESDGTVKLFSLAGPIVEALKFGRVLVIDELDARLHPLITCAIIRLFNSNKTNPNNAQLIFTTHDTNLLSNTIFRRDQIWFTEKNKQGATSLYSLAEFKVRNDASFERDYIQGRYGAIPFIGDFSKLMGKNNE